jgi:DNA-binding NtrC family response regulator
VSSQRPEVLMVGFSEDLHGRLAEVVWAGGGRAVFRDRLPSAKRESACAFLDGDTYSAQSLQEAVETLAERSIPAGVLVGSADPEQARAMGRAGAADYRAKPLTQEVVSALLRSGDPNADPGFITESPAMKRLLEKVRKLAASDGPGLLCGPSGTGKERLASFIHQSSPRAAGPFVAVNCAALPENLLESELFGHEKGAFTGADQRREGRFQQSDGGTLLLDEITEMPTDLQAKLLRVLQEGVVDRIGSNRPEPVDVRVLATTNREPEEAVEQGRMRNDLLYRLSVLRVRLPGLEQRPEDIPVLAEHFARLYANRYGRRIDGLDDEARQYLKGRSWPGNVRELENAIHRAVVLAEGPRLGVADLTEEELSIEMGLEESAHAETPAEGPVEPQAGAQTGAQTEAQTEAPAPDRGEDPPPEGEGQGSPSAVLPEENLTIREMEQLLIDRTLERVGGNRTRAAELLGVSIRTLRNKLNQR